jgi:hypothetical protein
MDLEALEVQRITATGLTVGRTATNKGIKVVGLSNGNTQSITGIITLFAEVDDSQVVFATKGSTFNALAAQADKALL